MAELLETLLNYLQENWMKIVWGIVIAGIGWYFGRRRARANWRKREFFNRVNVSLNRIEAGVLRIRTLSEKFAEEIFLNQHASEVIQQLALKTTEANPVIPFPKGEAWFYLNSVLNEISEQFASGLIRKDLGEKVSSDLYLICLTNEVSGAIKTRKIRAMVIKKSFLLNLPAEEPGFEHPSHAVRWATLKCLAGHYLKEPGDFLEVEIVV